MNPEMITLILNLVFGVFVFLGFLSGLRGIKKQTFSFASFIIQLVIIFFISPIVSNALTNINFGGQTLSEMISSGINDALGESLAANSFIQTLVSSLPVMIINIATTMLLLLAFALVFKIINATVYHIIYRKDKIKTVEKCELVNGTPQMVKTTVKKKKHRLAGGALGAVQGCLFSFVLFMPIFGAVNLASDVIGVNTVSAETQNSSEFELKPLREMLSENIPSDVFDYIKAIDNSIFSKVGSVANISETSFNLVARTTINGKSVKLGEEIRSLVNTYDAFVEFATTTTSNLSSTDFNAIIEDIKNNPENYDFNKLYNVIDKLFESNLINSMSDDLLKFVADIIVNENSDEETLKILNHVKSALYSYVESNASLKDDLKAFVGVLEVTLKSDLIPAIEQEPFDIDNVANVLLNEETSTKPENDVLNQILNKLTSSNLLQKFILEAINFGVGELEIVLDKELEFRDNYEVDLTKINSTQNVRVLPEELEELVVDAFDIYKKIENVDTDLIEQDPYEIFSSDVNIESIVRNAGNLLENVITMSVFKDTGVYASICNAMSYSNISEYIDFNVLKTENAISTQAGFLAESISALKDSGVVDILEENEDAETGDIIKQIIKKLAVSSNNQTNLSKIVSPLLKCTIVKPAVKYGLNEASNYIENALKEKNPNAELNNFNTEKLMTVDGNQDIISLLNNIVNLANNIDFDNLLSENFIDELLLDNNNFDYLGTAMDSIKSSSLFSDYIENGQTKQGVYKGLMDALANLDSFKDYFDFAVCKEEDFNWTETTAKLKTLANNLNSIIVQDKSLIKFILTSSDYSTVLDELRTWVLAEEGRSVSLTELFEIDLIKPTAINVINLINSSIKDFVDEEDTLEINQIGKNIKDIDATANISAQAQEINTVINKAILIDFKLIEQNGIDNISDEDLALVNSLLDTMELNASREDGVFKESYKALLIKIINTINSEIKTFVGEDLDENIVMLNGDYALAGTLQDIQDILSLALDFDLSSMTDINSIIDRKTTLNNLLDKVQNSVISGATCFGPAYFALITKTANLVNQNVQTLVGSDAGSKITTNSTYAYLTIQDVISVRAILNEVIDVANSKEFENINLADINIDNFIAFADLFYNNSSIVDGIFAETGNALYVFVINEINTAVSEEANSLYTNYNGNSTADRDSTEYILEKAKALFTVLEQTRENNENAELKDVAYTNEFKNFVKALELNDLTKVSFDSIENYLSGFGIVLSDIINS